MYALLVLINGITEVHFMETQQKCTDLLKQIKFNEYKIWPSSKINPFCMEALKWDAIIKDFVYDLEILKEIEKNHFRILRSACFKKLDLEFMKSIENNDEEKKQKIVNYKNQLRDITSIEFPKTAEEIIAFEPKILEQIHELF